jgi:hypothetical protein
MPKFYNAELSITLGGHKAVIKGHFEVTGPDFQVIDCEGSVVSERYDTVAGALIVEDRSNAKLIEQLEHVETKEVDGEFVDIGVSYSPLDASRIASPKEPASRRLK